MADAIARWFGVAPADRATRIASMLAGGKGEIAGYWLQLLLAMAIATLGLVLGSTAVVIGAMLVSPLMTPILSLGMGLAVGSPVLVLRSAIRIAASVALVVASAALITLVMPIHELTSEISSRTSPTALDLAIASCCAVAGVYAVIRPGSDTASAAAGTAIGIALVPPLCVVGYGFGVATIGIASGAALLFTANFCAILLFSVLGFRILGYGHVDIGLLERAHADEGPATGLTARVARRLSAFFASKLGPAVRVAMPLAMVLAVFWPLRSALSEVTWEIRVRAAASKALGSLTSASVYSSVRIERRQVSVRLVTIGSEADASRLRRALTDQIAAAAGVEPTVEVVAVPDAKSLARAEASLRDQPRPVATSAPARADLALVRRDARAALEAWPTDAAGKLLSWRLVVAEGDGSASLEVVHLGAPLGAAGESLLSQSLSTALHDKLRVRDIAFDVAPMTALSADGPAWLPRATSALEMLRALPEETKLFACVELPSGRGVDVAADGFRQSAARDPRVVVTKGAAWSLRWSTTACDPTPSAGDAAVADAGAPLDGDAGR